MKETTVASLNQTVAEKSVYDHVIFASAVTLTIFSPITIVTNVLLLAAIVKDPLKYFQKPTKYFVLGLAIADLLCGTIVEPCFAVHYFARYVEASEEFQAVTNTLFIIGSSIANASLNASFAMVLMLSVVHFIALEIPHRYKRWVKKRRVLTCVLISWSYFILFSLLPFLGVELSVCFKINLTLHSTLISLLLIIVQVGIFSSSRRRSLLNKITQFDSISCSDSRELSKTGRNTTRKGYGRAFDRHLSVMSIYLAAILLFSALPHIVVFHVFLYKKINNPDQEMFLNVALRITDLFLFAKVAADAFVFAWRLPTYQTSLGIILTGKMPQTATVV